MSDEGGIVTRVCFLDMQVCVPKDWTDKQVLEFAERENPCGTQGGWAVRRQDDAALLGDNERVQCADDPERVHIILDA